MEGRAKNHGRLSSSAELAGMNERYRVTPRQLPMSMAMAIGPPPRRAGAARKTLPSTVHRKVGAV